MAPLLKWGQGGWARKGSGLRSGSPSLDPLVALPLDLTHGWERMLLVSGRICPSVGSFAENKEKSYWGTPCRP